jgi:serralysin
MANIIEGTDDQDVLQGTNRADTIRGFDGGDYLYGNNGDDRLVGGDGWDDLYGGIGNDVLIGGPGRDKLYGGAGDDYLDGGSWSSVFDGGAGADTMKGGYAADIYYVQGNDTIIEEGNGSFQDRVYAAEDWTLHDYIEELRFTIHGDVNGTGNNGYNEIKGTDGRNVLNGRGYTDQLWGMNGNDKLIGGWGDDWLDGGRGADRMEGGTGFDHFQVDNVGDVVIDPDGGSISTSVSFDLRNTPNIDDAHLNNDDEDLYLIGNAKDNYLEGRFGQRIEGGAGDDRLAGASVLFGEAGNDLLDDHNAGGTQMYGGTGNDFYNTGLYETNIGFSNVFENENEGFDTLQSGLGIEYLPGGVFHVLENIEAYDISGDGITVMGDERDNYFMISGVLTLEAGAGNDSMVTWFNADSTLSYYGGTGDDVLGEALNSVETMTGGDGADRFLFQHQANFAETRTSDVIEDFEHGLDEIALSTATEFLEDGRPWYEGFTELGAPGDLGAAAFHAGTAAATADHRVIYDADTGALYYDRDGTGANTQILLATLTGSPDDVDHTDFVVV